jgi:tRNA(fMet)-specific endonuclease VapC
LLDTNVIVHYLKGMPSVIRMMREMPRREVAIPSVVACELEYGTLKAGGSRRRDMVFRLIADSKQVPFDNEAAMAAAGIRIDLESRGMTIGPIDLMVAGTALSRGAVLVTHNTREFERVRGLRLADWAE